MKKLPAEERAKNSLPKDNRTKPKDAADRNDVLSTIEPWDCATVDLTAWLRENGTWQVYRKRP